MAQSLTCFGCRQIVDDVFDAGHRAIPGKMSDIRGNRKLCVSEAKNLCRWDAISLATKIGTTYILKFPPTKNLRPILDIYDDTLDKTL
jgi:hypothetical protein